MSIKGSSSPFIHNHVRWIGHWNNLDFHLVFYATSFLLQAQYICKVRENDCIWRQYNKREKSKFVWISSFSIPSCLFTFGFNYYRTFRAKLKMSYVGLYKNWITLYTNEPTSADIHFTPPCMLLSTHKRSTE